MFKGTTYYIYFCTYNDVRLWIIYSKNNVNNDPIKMILHLEMAI